MANALHKVQQQSSIDQYMTVLQAFTGYSSNEFNSWFHIFEKVSTLTGNDPK